MKEKINKRTTKDSIEYLELQCIVNNRIHDYVAKYHNYPKYIKIPLWIFDCLKQTMCEVDLKIDYKTGEFSFFNLKVCETVSIEKTVDKIKIKLKDIVKLQHLYIDIFSEEDEDYPDNRVINNKERAVQRILDRITDKKFNQIEIWKVIQIKSWDTTDNTFKPICDRLRNLGYEIINNN